MFCEKHRKYNRCVSLCPPNDQSTPTTKENLRSLCINAKAENLPAWVVETPYDVREEGMNDFIKAFSTQKMLVEQ
jgi:hypothetical protein